MHIRQPRLRKPLLLCLMLIGIWMLWLPRAFDAASSDDASPHRVHIAFGFHVNLYHSFRGDTNDENGFGQDIRVIRHTIETLNRFNRQGVNVRAVWDFDSLFSLQEILPVHAPDIIADVRRRVHENGDDVILMSYNNGMMSAMTDEEFMVSMQRAISNDQGSGGRDLFGRVAPVVRPQEMMTTPGSFQRYRKMGIDTVSLYYSATPFDAFRMFSRTLSPVEAHNPIVYDNPTSGETIAILPTYHAGDLVENVSLRHWAQRLHRLQRDGTIDRDVLIFINFDADAEFWTGADLPPSLKWLPNTGGIGQLIESVADLDFVTFSNASDYLNTHPPIGRVHFGQDTADGSFNGYNSWAEKASTSDFWTRIERNRQTHVKARKMVGLADGEAMSPRLADLLHGSFETRLRALSTTNFGLATPFLSRPRETAMKAMLERLDDYTGQIDRQVDILAERLIHGASSHAPPDVAGVPLDTFVHLEGEAAGDRLLTFQMPVPPDGARGYLVADSQGRTIAATIDKREADASGGTARVTLRMASGEPMPDGLYRLYQVPAATSAAPSAHRSVHVDSRQLRNAFIRVRFDADGHVSGVTANGADQLDAGSLVPGMRYNGQWFRPSPLTVAVTADGTDGVGELRIRGPWAGPSGATRAPGWVDYRLRLVADVPYLFVNGTIRYPDTRRTAVIQADKPMLARRIDDAWQHVAPMELRFSPRARQSDPFVIHKYNYLGQTSAYAVDYDRHAPANRNVADINNHVTPAYAGVTTGGRGMAVAMNTAVQANFAFCPFQTAYHPESGDFTIRANPFGTYHGDQLMPPTRGNRLGYEAVLLSAPQLHSAAPTYNGIGDRFELMVAFFDGDAIPGKLKADLIAFARRPMTIAAHAAAPVPTPHAPRLPPGGLLALPDDGAVVFHWETSPLPGTRYRLRCRTVDGRWVYSRMAAGGTCRVDVARLPGAQPLTAAVQAIYPDGLESPFSPAIRFRPGPPPDPSLDIPPRFMARVLWANMAAWVRQNLL